MTLNIQNYQSQLGDWSRRKDLIVAAIQKSNPDVVALQSVRFDSEFSLLNQAEQLQEILLDYPFCVYERATVYSDTCADGSAILAKQPFLASDSLILCPDPTGEDPTVRLVLYTRFEGPAGLLHLFNAHFSYSPYGLICNLGQAIPYLEVFDGPRLLVGDFNATPDAEPLAWLRKRGWTDLGASQPTAPDSEGYTFPSFEPAMRIDYVWVDSHLKDRAGSIERAAVEAVAGVRASDHFGLVFTLTG